MFNPHKNSKIQNKTGLNKEAVATLLNELFVLDDQQTNEEIIQHYASRHNITVTWHAQIKVVVKACPGHIIMYHNLPLWYIVGFRQVLYCNWNKKMKKVVAEGRTSQQYTFIVDCWLWTGVFIVIEFFHVDWANTTTLKE